MPDYFTNPTLTIITMAKLSVSHDEIILYLHIAYCIYIYTVSIYIFNPIYNNAFKYKINCLICAAGLLYKYIYHT